MFYKTKRGHVVEAWQVNIDALRHKNLLPTWIIMSDAKVTVDGIYLGKVLVSPTEWIINNRGFKYREPNMRFQSLYRKCDKRT